MRVVITGATGNVGTALIRTLQTDPRVTSIVGVARRPPAARSTRAEWVAADVSADPLEPIFAGADAVVHLAWEIQPSHDTDRLWRTNVLGSTRTFAAVVATRVPALVYASSVGAYSAGPTTRRVDETWPTDGVRTCLYAVHKAEVERRLDDLQQSAPAIRVVRLRPGLIFQREAASAIGRLFIGPLLPRRLLRHGPFVSPHLEGLRFQAVHADDAARAYHLAITGDAAGAMNVAADPVLDTKLIAEVLGARPVRIPARLARGLAAATWRARLQPTHEGWLDMGFGVPTMDVSRAHETLGWRPRRTSVEALIELVDGLDRGSSAATPALRPGRFRRSPHGHRAATRHETPPDDGDAA